MKSATLLLAASLAANAALIAFVATRPAASASASSAPTSAPSATATPRSAPTSAAHAASSAGTDARDLALGRAFARFQQKIAASRAAASSGDQRWWRMRNAARSREDELLARRELSDALLTAFGDDFGLGGGDPAQLAFLSPEKRTALRRITQDYDEMMAKFGAGGVQLASDKEKLKLLRAERDRDIAALLSPTELADYELRTSTSAATVRARYGDALETEDDFKKIYALQKALDEKFPVDALSGRVTPETMRARSDAQRQMQDDIRAAVGEDKYAALRRATDGELRTLDSLVARVGLPANTTDRVATARETYAAQSQRINADTSLSPADRRTALINLGIKANSDLATTLGAEVADAFAPHASWVRMLQNGLAFSTTPVATSPGMLSLGGGTQSVFAVMPAGVPAGTAGTTRQVVNVVNSTTDTLSASPSSGVFFSSGALAPGEPATSRTMQVISIGAPVTTGPNPHGETTTPTPTTPPAPKP